MLLAKTAVKSSPIAGVGLFAEEDIRQGQLVWRYTPDSCVIVTETQLKALLNSFHKTEDSIIHYYLTYGYYVTRLNGLVICLDNARFVNHSNEPNCGSAPGASDESMWQYSVALRDIKKGEEITESYATYDSSSWLENLCAEYNIFSHTLLNEIF